VRKGRRRHEEAHQEEEGNHEAWVIPYADMLTLLMGLFLVLWAIGNEDLEKMRQFSASFASHVGISSPFTGGEGILDGSPTAAEVTTTTVAPVASPIEDAAAAALEREEAHERAAAVAAQELDRAESVIREHARVEGVDDAVSFRREERGLVVSIVADDVLFEPGSAHVEAAGSRALDAVAAALRSLDNQIAIEGHTDDRPISNSRFPSNWELSTARAGAVLRYLVDHHGLPPSRMTAAGYAEQRPLASNATPEGRAKNRRVDVAVYSKVTRTDARALTESEAGR